jgi:ABC-type uncharacterized transport system substrate-binding protein
MAYAIDRNNLFRQVAHYIDTIFKGAKPGEIPIYQSDKFTTIINLKAAKSQGITIPESLVLRADNVCLVASVGAAKLTAVPAGAISASRGVQSLL